MCKRILVTQTGVALLPTAPRARRARGLVADVQGRRRFAHPALDYVAAAQIREQARRASRVKAHALEGGSEE